ncbi:MAG: hypothetical protein EOP50_00160 [Sphingobacteriales bacterium]|nr:MAG: hypothetical protein EOP50_00160 [Sphingobacteriales bacterium]
MTAPEHMRKIKITYLDGSEKEVELNPFKQRYLDNGDFGNKSPESLDRQNTVWKEIIARNCDHLWQPVSFQFGQFSGAPDLRDGRVYCVCMKCASHTYLKTSWYGAYIGGPDDLEEQFMEEEREG